MKFSAITPDLCPACGRQQRVPAFTPDPFPTGTGDRTRPFPLPAGKGWGVKGGRGTRGPWAGRRLLAAAAALGTPALAQQTGVTPKPAIVIESSEHCIAAPEVMRRQHPDMLKHQRDRTVHLGERGAKVSLNECIRCHANRQTGSVIGSDQAFCQGCHSYAAVRIDCFDCHQPSVRPSLASLARENAR